MPSEPSEPPEPAIRIELARILAHKLLACAPLQRRILGLIVDESLQGRGNTLKEEVIAELLGLKEYDKKKNSLIRGDIGKLRQNLDKYYAAADDPQVRLEIPKHGFAAKFKWIDASRQTQPEFRPPDDPPPGRHENVAQRDMNIGHRRRLCSARSRPLLRLYWR